MLASTYLAVVLDAHSAHDNTVAQPYTITNDTVLADADVRSNETALAHSGSGRHQHVASEVAAGRQSCGVVDA